MLASNANCNDISWNQLTCYHFLLKLFKLAYILSNMNKLITIQEAATFLGVSPQTLRRWEREGRGIPFQKTAGGQRDTILQNYILKTYRPLKINSLH